MSGKNKRAKRKILLLVRMDKQRMLKNETAGMSLVNCGMMPLGKKLARMGLTDRAGAALKQSGSDIT